MKKNSSVWKSKWFFWKYKFNRDPGKHSPLTFFSLSIPWIVQKRIGAFVKNPWTDVVLGVRLVNLARSASEEVPVLSVLLQFAVPSAVLTQLFWGRQLARCSDWDQTPAFLKGRGCGGAVAWAVPEAAVLAREEPCRAAAQEQARRGQGKTGTLFSGFTWEQKKRYFVMTPPESRSHWLPGGWAASTLLGAVVSFFPRDTCSDP